MKPLPQGKSLGWMQAPASWITTHTTRFIGVVRVVIKGGEGFILIKKGKPLFYYFKRGTIELKGNAALDYFNFHPLIDFHLCKYNRDEFARALNLCDIVDHEPVVTNASVVVSRQQSGPFRPADPSASRPVEDKRIPEPDLVYPKELRIERTTVSEPVSRKPSVKVQPEDQPVANPSGDTKIPEPDLVYPKDQRIERTTVSEPVSGETTLSSRPADPLFAEPPAVKKIPAPVEACPRVHTPHKRAVVTQPGDGDDESDLTILSQIRQIDGIVAISVFNDNCIVVTLGDTDSGALLKIARTMLETAKKITPRNTWGPFVHMTIGLPAGNMIIAPYHDNYLCLLTTRAINIGHIRKILRDLQRKSATQCMI